MHTGFYITVASTTEQQPAATDRRRRRRCRCRHPIRRDKRIKHKSYIYIYIGAIERDFRREARVSWSDFHGKATCVCRRSGAPQQSLYGVDLSDRCHTLSRRSIWHLNGHHSIAQCPVVNSSSVFLFYSASSSDLSTLLVFVQQQQVELRRRLYYSFLYMLYDATSIIYSV